MSKQAIYPSQGGAPVGGAPYTPAVKIGDTVYISGQLGLDPETGKPFESFEAQVEGAINGLRRLCEAAGGSLDSIVKTTVFLADLGQFSTLNTIYAKHFTATVRPARSTFQVAALPLGAAVEIEAVAVI